MKTNRATKKVNDYPYSPSAAKVLNSMLKTTLLLLCMLLQPLAVRANIVVLGDLTHEYLMKYGETHEAVIELENRDMVTRHVRIYQTDYKYPTTGESFFPAPGSMERSNAVWITFSPRSITIPPMRKAQIRYLIRAPKDRWFTGTYWSMLMIQEMQGQAPGNRYGVLVLTQLADSGKIGLEFTSATVGSKNGQRILTVDIENKGTRAARPELWLEVYNSMGQKAGRFITNQSTILPGCGTRREIDISSLPKGTYNSLFIADCGGKDVFGLEIKLVLEGEPDPKTAPAGK
jgi:hypothetical protein